MDASVFRMMIDHQVKQASLSPLAKKVLIGSGAAVGAGVLVALSLPSEVSKQVDWVDSPEGRAHYDQHRQEEERQMLQEARAHDSLPLLKRMFS